MRALVVRFAQAMGIVVAILVFASPAHAAPADNVYGWAWNAAAGWIAVNSENCIALNIANEPDPCALAGRTYGLTIASNGAVTGYAWSEVLGWMCVGATCAGSGGATPSGGWIARVNALTSEATGWAKMLALGDSGWVSLSCVNTASCAAVPYRTTVDSANGKFAGHAWSSAATGRGVGWIAWQPTFGGVTTTWRPEPRCAQSGAACAADIDCALPGEYCCLGGAACGQCGGAGAACGAHAQCPVGALCCRPGVACGACVADGAACGDIAACGGARDSCCPSGAICTGGSDGTGGGGAGGGAPDVGGGAVTPVIGVCVNQAALCVDVTQCGGESCDLGQQICATPGALQRCADNTACGVTTCDADLGIRTDIVRSEKNPTGAAVPCATDDVNCGKVIGKCTGTERLCAVDGNCPERESCGKLYLPWVETRYGSLYSTGRVGTARTPPPPAGKFNATYCILAGGQIVNFRSAEGCGAVPRSPYGPITVPRAPTYIGSVARFDIPALLRGRFGAVVSTEPVLAIPENLSGKVYVVEGNASIGKTTFARGAGLVIVRGGDLTISGDLTYADQPPANVRDLASPGWLVLATTDAQGKRIGGNITIDPSVTAIVGAFYAEGAIRTGTTSTARDDRPLVVRGVMVARQFIFERLAAGATGAEQIIADGRVLVNPPPGFGDFMKALPEIRQSAP